MKDSEAPAPAHVSAKQIDEWLDKYGEGEVHEIVVALDAITFDPHLIQDEDLTNVGTTSCFIRTPDEKVKNFALRLIANPQDAGSVIIKNCWLGGDDRIRTDKGLLASAALKVLEFIEIHQVQLKKPRRSGQK